ncbi:MAG TPA: O-antigen ligase family protein [Solirubrobacteraceae bacterium]|nr:O-antigen ligase family protein [Solirubrobacteraceae bacterium]
MTRTLNALQARLRTEVAVLLPAGLAIAVVIAWAATGGGYESQPALSGYAPDPWYLGALGLVGLTCATAVGVGRVRLSRRATIACGALTAYVAWSFLSVLWAHDQGTAFLGSDRALVYLAAFVTFAILPWSNWSARGALALFVGGIGAVAIVTAIRVAALGDPSGLYLSERLAYPLGYYNADAALFMTGAVTAVALSAQRSGTAALRVGGLLVAAVCLQLAVLSQSRGWLFTVPIVLALTLLLVPGRLRLLAFALIPAAATAAIAPALLRIYGRASPGGTPLTQPRLSHVLHQQGGHAVHAMLIADIALSIVAALAVALDRRVMLSRSAHRRTNRIAAGLALALALAGIAAGLIAVHGDPIGRAERAWHSFADAGETTGGSSSHFTTLASNRADIWRVALHEFTRHPLLGIGQDNFATSYTRLRHTQEEPRWAHSIELRLLVHTGLIGALLFALFMLAALLGALRGRRAGAERVTGGILLLPLVVWLVHGSIDWFWEYPVLSVPALAFLGAATALRQRPVSAAPSAGGRRRGVAVVWWAGAALLGAGALVALAIPFIAARRVQKAIAVWPAQPALAYSQLRSASSLMPFDAQIDVVGGAIALNQGENDEARAWLLRAERREAEGWLTPFLLGLIDGEQGRRRQGRVELLRARRLNPREAAIAEALERIGGTHPLTFVEAQILLTPHIATPPA